MKPPRGLPNAEARWLHGVMADLGWQLKRATTHFVYSHPKFPEVLTIPCTPSDWRWLENDLARLRRLHPDAAALKKRPSHQKRSRVVAGAFGSATVAPEITDQELAEARDARNLADAPDPGIRTRSVAEIPNRSAREFRVPCPNCEAGVRVPCFAVRTCPERLAEAAKPIRRGPQTRRNGPVVKKFVCPVCAGSHPRQQCPLQETA